MKAAACLVGVDTFASAHLCGIRSRLGRMLNARVRMEDGLENVTASHQMLSG